MPEEVDALGAPARRRFTLGGLFRRGEARWGRGPSARRTSRAPYLLLLPVVAALAIGLVLPTLSLVIQSFTDTSALGRELGHSVDAYGRVATNEVYRDSIITTLLLAVPAAFLCVVLAYPVAFFLAFRARRSRNAILFLIILSSFASFIVRVYAWRIVLGDSGLINQGLIELGVIDEPLLFLIFSRFAVLITWLSVFLPLTILILTASMLNVRPELLENARDLGAGALRTFTRVLLPLTLPGAVGAFIFVLIFAASDFITPEQLGGNLGFVGLYIRGQYVSIGGDRGGAAALAFVVMAIFALIYLLLSRVQRFKGY